MCPPEEQPPANPPLVNGDSARHQKPRTDLATRRAQQQRRNPYASSRPEDFLSNIGNFSIIESTLRGMLVRLIPRRLVSYSLSLALQRAEQRANSLPTHSLTRKQKLPLRRLWTLSEWNTSSSHRPQLQNNPGRTALPYATSG